MPAKNTNKPAASRQVGVLADWKWLLKWVFILGGLIAGVANVMAQQNEGVQDQLLVSGLMLVGIVVGIFYFDSNDVINIGLRYLIFTAVANSLGGFYKVGSYLSGFLTGFSYFLGTIVLTLCIVYFVKKYLLNRA